jgi:flagellar biosynthesis/type III secretory pathway protein FliH
MSLSSLLRGETFAVLDRPMLGGEVPRIFGTRVLRGENVGLQTPMPLAAPLGTPALDDNMAVLKHEDGASAPPPADFADIKEAARVQGYSVGFEQGNAAGLAAADEAMADTLHRLTALINGVHESHSAFFRSAERQVVDLALQIAQKVVEREVENMPDLAVNVIRAALEEMDGRTAVRVRVSPDDEELLRRRWSQVVPPGIGADRIELQQDERVQSGGAIIETTHGQVDAQLESKLAQLGNALWTFVMDVNSQEQADEIDA